MIKVIGEMQVVSPKSVASQPVPKRPYHFSQFDVSPKSPIIMREGQSIGAASRLYDVSSKG